ncbi:MAG TPA: hypothetical protein VIV60_01800 [Polyangiaceae bacterium]
MSRATARGLGVEGLAAYDSGDLPKALDRLSRAYRLHRVPTLALWNGRVLAKMGKFVAASERLREALNMNVSGGDREAQAAAQATAARELDALQVKIGSLQVEVPGEIDPASHLVIDDTEVPLAVIGTPMPMDPGEHMIMLDTGKTTHRQRVQVTEGATQSVVLSANSEKPAHHSEALGAAAALGSSRSDPTSSSESNWQNRVGWVALGIGTLGIGTWAVTGAIALNRDKDLGEQCPEDKCPLDYRSKLDGFRELRMISSISFVTGLVGLGAGGALLLTAPRASGSGSRASWRAWVGVNAVGFAKEY